MIYKLRQFAQDNIDKLDWVRNPGSYTYLLEGGIKWVRNPGSYTYLLEDGVKLGSGIQRDFYKIFFLHFKNKSINDVENIIY